MTTQQKEKLTKEFSEVINRNSAEIGSNTPDFILAEHLVNSLESFDKSTRQRDTWYHDSRKKINKES